MEKQKQTASDWENLTGAWMKSVADFWNQPMTAMWQKGGVGAWGSSPLSGQGPAKGIEEWWTGTLKVLQAMHPLNVQGAFMGKGSSTTQNMAGSPEMFYGLAQFGMDGYLDLQKRWMEAMAEAGKNVQSGAGDESSGVIISTWLEVFQNVISPLLNIPALGLTRSYQEKFNQTIEKFHSVSADVGELVRQLCVPVERSTKALRERLEELEKEGKLPSDQKESYNIWISILERTYMELLRSPEYIQSLHRTIDGLSDYSKAQEQLFSDSLKAFPFPSLKDFDELAKEIHTLKKRLKEVSKRVDIHEQLIDRQAVSESGSKKITN